MQATQSNTRIDNVHEWFDTWVNDPAHKPNTGLTDTDPYRAGDMEEDTFMALVEHDDSIDWGVNVLMRNGKPVAWYDIENKCGYISK